MVRDVHLHLSSGTALAWRLDDHAADDVVGLVRAFWRDPAAVRDDPVIALGEHNEPDSWIPLGQIVAVQSYPVTGTAADDREEVAADGPS